MTAYIKIPLEPEYSGSGRYPNSGSVSIYGNYTANLLGLAKSDQTSSVLSSSLTVSNVGNETGLFVDINNGAFSFNNISGSDFYDSIITQTSGGNISLQLIKQVRYGSFVASASRLSTNGIDSSSVDFTGIVSPSLSSYSAGQRFLVQFGTATMSGTLNISGLGAVTIKERTNTDPSVNIPAHIRQDQVAELVYDGTDFVITNPPPTFVSSSTLGLWTSGTQGGGVYCSTVGTPAVSSTSSYLGVGYSMFYTPSLINDLTRSFQPEYSTNIDSWFCPENNFSAITSNIQVVKGAAYDPINNITYIAGSGSTTAGIYQFTGDGVSQTRLHPTLQVWEYAQATISQTGNASRTLDNLGTPLIWAGAPANKIFCITNKDVMWVSGAGSVNLMSVTHSLGQMTSIAYSPQLDRYVGVSRQATGPTIWGRGSGTPTLNTGSNIGKPTRHVTWSPELGIFIAVVEKSDSTYAYTSPDGLAWTAQTTSVTKPNITESFLSSTWCPEIGMFIFTGQSASLYCAPTPNNVITISSSVTAMTGSTFYTNAPYTHGAWIPHVRQFIAGSPSSSWLQCLNTNGVAPRANIDELARTPKYEGTIPATPTASYINGGGFQWNRIKWSPQLGLFCAVAMNGITSSVSSSRIITSPDGINWTPRTTPANGGGQGWAGLCWSPEKSIFVAVTPSGSNRVMTSSNGINWGLGTCPAQKWESVCWSSASNLFVAVGTGSTNTTAVMTSPDGVTWTQRTSPNQKGTYFDVTYINELGNFYAAGHDLTLNANSLAMSSSDGINWSIPSTGSFDSTKRLSWSPEKRILMIGGHAWVIFSDNAVSWNSSLVEWGINPNMTRYFWARNVGTWAPELGTFFILPTLPTVGYSRINDQPFGVSSYAVLSSRTPALLGSELPNGNNWTRGDSQDRSYISREWELSYGAKSNVLDIVDTKPWTDICWAPELGAFCAVAQNSGTSTSGSQILTTYF